MVEAVNYGTGAFGVVLGIGGAGPAVGALRGGNMPNRAVGRIVPGVIFLNSNILPKRTC